MFWQSHLMYQSFEILGPGIRGIWSLTPTSEHRFSQVWPINLSLQLSCSYAQIHLVLVGANLNYLGLTSMNKLWRKNILIYPLVHQILTLVLLHILKWHIHFCFPANSISWFEFIHWILKLHVKQCRSWSDGFFRSKLI